MLFQDLQLNRNLYKSPQQNDGTKSSEYMASNPIPLGNRQNYRGKPTSQNTGDDDGAPNVITGSVITACFIQTTTLPDRIEMAGNDLTLYDNTFTEDGVVKGNTARMVFTHDLNSQEGFIMEKRASVRNTYDNVISWFATPAKNDRDNYIFIGRNAFQTDQQRNTNGLVFGINTKSDVPGDFSDPRQALNGIIRIESAVDGTSQGIVFIAGNALAISGNAITGGSAYMRAYGGGEVGWAYDSATVWYASNATTILPGAAGVNIGSALNKFGTFYGSVSACPLPVPNRPALDILDELPAPTTVGERGHYGDDILYYDNITAPEELLHTDSEGYKDFEHGKTIGFLMKAVIELHQEVKRLKALLPNE